MTTAHVYVGDERSILSERDASERVIDVIEGGGLAVVPLDVSYAFLAGDAKSLGRIFELKLRPLSRPCPILASWEHFENVSAGSDEEIARVKKVVDAGLPVGVVTAPRWESDVGASIPEECKDLLLRDGNLALFINMGGMSEALIRVADARGVRLFGSSANISGKGNSFSIKDVPDSMLEAVQIVCDTGTCKYVNAERCASSIIDMKEGVLLRQGILHKEIESLLS